MVYNCRCTLIADVEGVDTSYTLRRDRRGLLPDMTFAQWENTKRGEGYLAAAEFERKEKEREARDRKQYAGYKAVLGKNMPKTFAKFKDLKYNDTEKWEFLKLDYVRRNKLINHPEMVLPGVDNATAPSKKFTHYLFNPENEDGWAKGVAFTSRLGYSAENWESLQSEIMRGAKRYTAVFKRNNGYGDLYEQHMVLYGKKGDLLMLSLGGYAIQMESPA